MGVCSFSYLFFRVYVYNAMSSSDSGNIQMALLTFCPGPPPQTNVNSNKKHSVSTSVKPTLIGASFFVVSPRGEG